jgi:dTDP-4-dehydrorhamnose reductase
MKPIVLVTGAAGLIGQYLMKSAARWAPAWEARGLTRQEVDLTDAAQVRALVSSINPQAIIHCAALSRTKDCEQDPARAHRNNVEATARLARAGPRYSVRLSFERGSVRWSARLVRRDG